jgi:DNA polymerase III alpha subunit
MKTDQYSQLIFSETDLVDLLMQGNKIDRYHDMIVDSTVDIEKIIDLIDDNSFATTWQKESNLSLTVEEFDKTQQSNWYMPDQYKSLDIAEHVLSLCATPAQLQRVGHELLLYQEKNLFDLLRYLKYLVDVMTNNSIIWGVGRGSSVASYVLYLLKVHRIDSMYYELQPEEFLR